MTAFIGLMVREDFGSKPYELLLRADDIISLSPEHVTYRIAEDDTVDSQILAEDLSAVAIRLEKAGIPVYR